MEEITLSIFIPCFNEEENITNALNSIKEGVKNINYEILVVDDASTDKTVEVIKEYKNANQNINIKIFQNQKNKGIGFNFWATAQKASGKYYMIVFGDGGIPSEEINKIVNKIGKADMILTYFNDKRGIFRRSLSVMFVTIINIITFNNIKYYNSDNIHLLENVKSCSGRAVGFGFQAELITEQIRKKKNYIEIEIKPSFKTKKLLSETSQALKFHNILSVSGSVISIFLKQILHIVRIIFFKNK